jgi:hypothetical protein
VIWETGLPVLVIAAMNGDQERSERLRRESAEDIEAEIMAYFCRTGDLGVREAAAVVRAYIARGLQRYAEPPRGPFARPSESEPF